MGSHWELCIHVYTCIIHVVCYLHVCCLDAVPQSTGQGIQEATEDGESLLSLACSAGYYELAEVLLRMKASVEDRGVKGQLPMQLHSTGSGLMTYPVASTPHAG